MDVQASRKAEGETETILLESDDENDTPASRPAADNSDGTPAIATESAIPNIETPEIAREQPPEDPKELEQVAETPAAEKEEDVILIVDDEKEPDNPDQTDAPISEQPSTEEPHAVDCSVEDSTVTDALASQIGNLCSTGNDQDVFSENVDEKMQEDRQEQENAEAPGEAEQNQNDIENEEQTKLTEGEDAFEMLVEATIEDIAAAVDGNFELDAEPGEEVYEKENAEPAKAELKADPEPAVPRSDCCNLECSSTCREYVKAPMFAINFYNDSMKKKKVPLLCTDCFEAVIREYENYCSMIVNQTPVVRNDPPKKEVVEIIDSDDDEDTDKIDLLKFQDETPVHQDIIALVESQLEDVIKETFDKYKIQKQVEESLDYIKKIIAKNEDCSRYLEPTLKQMSKRTDEQLFAIYAAKKMEIKQLPELIIRNDDDSDIHRREPIAQSQVYYASGDKLFAKWNECRVVDKVKRNNELLYYIQFLQPEGSPKYLRSAKCIAYRTAPKGNVKLGTRVIAKIDSYVDKGESVQDAFYPGVVAETLCIYNRYRYLVFYDDGYAQYVPPKDLRVVCFQSKPVWEDVDIHSREFIKNYLLEVSKIRKMVKVKPYQRLITERNATWYDTVVTRLDASLIEVYFPALKRHEWIYRGSTRFAPLFFKKPQQSDNKKYSKLQQRNEPSIEYMTIDDDDEKSVDGKEGAPKSSCDVMQQTTEPSPASQPSSQGPKEARSDAAGKAKQTQMTRKSTVDRPTYLNQNIIYCDNDRVEGKTTHYTTIRYRPPQKFKPHNCGPGCLYGLALDMRKFSHLGKPLLCGWERQICISHFKKLSSVVYRGPCGRRMRSMAEVHRYLRITKATLNVDNFDFDPQLRVLAEYRPQNLVVNIEDVSNGLEYTPVSCVNYFDDTKPPPCEYSTKRIPTEGVNLNLDEDFLVCCDCEDDCFDKSKCQCWQLTIEGAKFLSPELPIESIGYVYKRLEESVMTGIYECNARCKCKMDCLNRVVQHPLLTKLQIFKTSNRGWGIRCLNDIAKGSFICVYSGHLITDEASNQICAQNEDQTGDEYYAELDYIETVQNTKEGYESDVSNTEDDEEDELRDKNGPNEDSDSPPEYGATKEEPDSDEEFTYKSKPSRMAVKTRSQIRKLVTELQDDELAGEKQKKIDSGERELINLAPNKEMSRAEALGKTKKRKSLRDYYGENEATYIMDAKKSGNLGRYFNHSCVPNLFVQNVFVDTHDARFPWVAFFAQKLIKAGSELTWNYNYDVGSVAGKVLYCHCGEKECRKRLL